MSTRAFALALVVAVAASSAAAADPLVIDASTARVEQGYRNGRAIKVKVVTIGWADVEIATARAFAKMHAAAEADGVGLLIRSGFRSHEQQEWLYQAWKSGYGNPAAKPGYSNHQSGRALDLMLGSRGLAWLTKHAKRYGFKRTVKREPWHWEYVRRRK